MKHDCKEEAKARYWLWFDGVWMFDTNDGLRGPEISFCPFCGEKLVPVAMADKDVTALG